MAQVDEGWSGDKNDLQHPEADVRNGEGFVIANIFATRLLNLLSSSPQHQYPEDKQYRQPNLANNRGKAPVTHCFRFLTYNKNIRVNNVPGLCYFHTVQTQKNNY
uniref:Uncharacterized protein n=1 Tax=Bubo bubo TaxID=30461 RepID=A0A8C0F0N1_BUBBB